jgi:hypothetical protein
VVADQPRFLQLADGDPDTLARHPEHEGEELLGQEELVSFGSILRGEEPPGRPL